MTDPRPTLLLSRPRAESRAFAAAFRARHGADWPVIVAPVLELAPTGAVVPGFDIAIFTSRHAVAALAPGGGRRAYCVGARTAEAARAAGFSVQAGAGTAADLLDLIRAERPAGRLLHARGDTVAVPLAEQLTLAGLETQEAVVYHQQPQPFAPDLLDRINAAGRLVAPVFSPRSAQLLAQRLAGLRLKLSVAAISPAVARAAQALHPDRIAVAPQPDRAGVEAAVSRLLGAADPG